jgi:hypothetical protein
MLVTLYLNKFKINRSDQPETHLFIRKKIYAQPEAALLIMENKRISVLDMIYR